MPTHKADRRIAAAKELEAKLKEEGRYFDAQVVTDLRLSYSSSRVLNKELQKDLQKALGHDA